MFTQQLPTREQQSSRLDLRVPYSVSNYARTIRAHAYLSAPTRGDTHQCWTDTHTPAWSMPPEHTHAPFSLLSKEKQLHSSTTVVSLAACAHAHTHTHRPSLSHTRTHDALNQPVLNMTGLRTHQNAAVTTDTAWLPVAVRNQ